MRFCRCGRNRISSRRRRHRRCSISPPRRSPHTAYNTRIQPACEPTTSCSADASAAWCTPTSSGRGASEHRSGQGGRRHRLQQRFLRSDGSPSPEPRAGPSVVAKDGGTEAAEEVVQPARKAVVPCREEVVRVGERGEYADEGRKEGNERRFGKDEEGREEVRREAVRESQDRVEEAEVIQGRDQSMRLVADTK